MASKIHLVHNWWCSFNWSVADPDPDPPDPCVLGHPGPDPDPLIRGMDPDPDLDLDPSNIKQNSKKTLISTVL
jgi:hypothetical protein